MSMQLSVYLLLVGIMYTLNHTALFIFYRPYVLNIVAKTTQKDVFLNLWGLPAKNVPFKVNVLSSIHQ